MFRSMYKNDVRTLRGSARQPTLFLCVLVVYKCYIIALWVHIKELCSTWATVIPANGSVYVHFPVEGTIRAKVHLLPLMYFMYVCTCVCYV